MPAEHTLQAERADTAASPAVITGSGLDDYRQYLTDESRRTGRAEALVFPRSTADVAAAVRVAADRGWGVTVSGARTGITAGAVPGDGMVLSLDRLNCVRGLRRSRDGAVLVSCEAGVMLSDLQGSLQEGRFPEAATWGRCSVDLLAEIKEHRLFYPPDPTETSASIGGTVACNASGAHTFRYGPTRRYVHSLEIVLADGSVLNLERGREAADAHGGFVLRRLDGTETPVRLPTYRQPATKNAAGYFAEPGMDLVDLFIGSEGTLGIITAAELRLVPASASTCMAVIFWESEASALQFTSRVRRQRGELGLLAVEYMGPRALSMLRERRRGMGAASGVPECLPPDAACAVYLDIGASVAEFRQALVGLADIVRSLGGDPERCWSGQTRDERERLRLFRHALPETVNARIAEARRIHPTITKLGTDMAVPDDCLEDVVRLYRTHLDAHGLDYVIFGHIGDNHLHVNILPRTPEDYATGHELYVMFARDVVRMGGSPSAEHGVGKLKTAFLEIAFGAEGVAQMRAVKNALDPEWRLGKGTLFA